MFGFLALLVLMAENIIFHISVLTVIKKGLLIIVTCPQLDRHCTSLMLRCILRFKLVSVKDGNQMRPQIFSARIAAAVR